jgi:DNA polymerase-3 subunit delta'
MSELSLPDQPLAERALRAALAQPAPPQQLLFFGPPGCGKRAAARDVAWAIMDPSGAHDRRAAAVDLIEVRASGREIRLEELDPAIAAIAARPHVLERRVLIIEGAERLREQEGSSRILKPLEEPAPRSHVILVTERAGGLPPTIRSRCLPVPFRSPGAARIAQRLMEAGMPEDEARRRARADGTAALDMDPFDLRMRALGRDIGRAALTGERGPRALVARVEGVIEQAAAENPSEQLAQLQREAKEKEGRRGGRTAEKRVEEQRRRELRRLSTDGWQSVLRAAAGVAADALAARSGAPQAARDPQTAAELAATTEATPLPSLIHIVEEFERAVADLALNPDIPVRAEALLRRVARARHGHPVALSASGRPSI